MEGRNGLLTSQGDPSEAFDSVEETFHKVTLFVEHPVDGFVCGARRVLFDLGRCAKIVGDEVTQVIGIIGGVGHDMADARKPFDQVSLCC